VTIVRRTTPVRTIIRNREIVTSPLMRAVYAPRRRATTVAYHPAYLTGRIVRVTPREVVLAPATGPEVVVTGYVPPSYVVNRYVTVPAVYNNGGYYAYPYSNQYQSQIEQLAAMLFGVPVSYSNGYYVPQQTYYGNTPYYGYGAANGYYPYNGYANSGYANGVCENGYGQYTYCGAQPVQASYYGSTPYDNCMWTTDQYGNGYCAAQQSYGYNPYAGQYASYGNYGTYAPQQIQGLVVAKTGSMLMVLGGNGLNPVFVNDSLATQNGYAMNGPVAVGQIVNAYGYYSGDTFVATALM